ncbi:MAG: TraB/GumN family protein [Kiloniellaceae bacterium]
MRRYLPLKPIQGALGLLLTGILVLGALLPSAMAAEDIRFGQGLLWKVQKDGGPVSYVLGTIHSTDSRLHDLPPQIDGALDESRTIAFEFIGTPDQQQKMVQAIQLPPGEQLEEILGPELFERTVATLQPLGIPARLLQGLKPWSLSLYLVLPPIELARQAQGKPAFDFWLQAEAKRRGKQLHSLESIEEQIALFDDMSRNDQVAMVEDMLADYANIEANFSRLFRAYLRGDISSLMKQANDYSEVSDAAAAERLSERLLDDRNVSMMQSMLPLLLQGEAFVAIGALHLPGEGGVLDLLEQRGYRVTRAY